MASSRTVFNDPEIWVEAIFGCDTSDSWSLMLQHAEYGGPIHTTQAKVVGPVVYVLFTLAEMAFETAGPEVPDSLRRRSLMTMLAARLTIAKALLEVTECP